MLSRQSVWLNHRSVSAYQHDLGSLTEQISKLTNISLVNTNCTITLHREHRNSVIAFNFKILLDGEKIGEIPNDESRKFQISLGRHSLYLECGTRALGSLLFSASDKLSFTIGHGENKRFVCHANFLNKQYIDLKEDDR
jgi:hypothetical protein